MTDSLNIRIFGFVDNSQVDLLFKTLSDPTRRQLIRLLGEAPLGVGELVEIANLPQSTVSRHIKTLRATGLLVDRRHGSRTFTSLLEPVGYGNAELKDLLNSWMREQPLSDGLRLRLENVLRARQDQADDFEQIAYGWDELRRRYFGSHFQLEALCALLPGNWEVLDVGTGTGYLLPVLARQFDRVTAVDPSPSMLELARQRAEKEGLRNVEFKFGRLESIPVPDKSIDAVIAILVLHHAGDLAVSVRELFRVLKPAGQLLIVDLVPHEMDTFQREMGDPVKGIDASSLTNLLEQTGFHVACRRRLATTSAETGPTRAAPDMYLIKADKTSS